MKQNCIKLSASDCRSNITDSGVSFTGRKNGVTKSIEKYFNPPIKQPNTSKRKRMLDGFKSSRSIMHIFQLRKDTEPKKI